MECTVVHTMKYLFYKVIMNDTISSDDFGLSGYRKIIYVIFKKQMCPLSSGYHCVIKTVEFVAHTSDLYWHLNSSYFLFVILRMEAYILNVWVLRELKQKFSVPEFILLIYGIDSGLWAFQNTRMYSMLHFKLYNDIACSCISFGLIFINFLAFYNRNEKVNGIWNSWSYCISALK